VVVVVVEKNKMECETCTFEHSVLMMMDIEVWQQISLSHSD
jgi:hypothetical protein